MNLGQEQQINPGRDPRINQGRGPPTPISAPLAGLGPTVRYFKTCERYLSCRGCLAAKLGTNAQVRAPRQTPKLQVCQERWVSRS